MKAQTGCLSLLVGAVLWVIIPTKMSEFFVAHGNTSPMANNLRNNNESAFFFLVFLAIGQVVGAILNFVFGAIAGAEKSHERWIWFGALFLSQLVLPVASTWWLFTQ